MPRLGEYKNKQEAHSVTAPRELWMLAEALGDGNRSEGVRIVLSRAMGIRKANKLKRDN